LLLLGTGEAKLIEHTENDDFWGDGDDGSGRNELGRVLMAVRKCLREESE
jgi:N-glycosidase YbiA